MTDPCDEIVRASPILSRLPESGIAEYWPATLVLVRAHVRSYDTLRRIFVLPSPRDQVIANHNALLDGGWVAKARIK